MKYPYMSLIAIMILVIAVGISGCTGGSPATPSGGGTQATPAAGTSTGTPASGGGQASAVSGADLFGNLNYNWVEYRMSTGSGSDAMTIYYKWNRQTGKCSMRFEGAAASQMPGGIQEMDCTPTGGSKAASDPNAVNPDAKVDCSLLDETVTVPAGTFSATKCTVTAKEGTSTSWVAKGKFLVKTQVQTPEGTMDMVLNAYG